MKRKVFTIILVIALGAAMIACSKKEEETTTITGMVVSVDGTVLSLVESDGEAFQLSTQPSGGPQMPSGMEGFENFDPEDFAGAFPGGGSMPQLPDGMTMPDFGGEFPGGMPNFGGSQSGGDLDYEELFADMQTKEVDIGDAHISVEIEGGKATGSMDDIKTGRVVTITMNAKGEVTNVLVSSTSVFGN